MPSLQVAQSGNTMEEEYSLLSNRPKFNILDRTLKGKDNTEKEGKLCEIDSCR